MMRAAEPPGDFRKFLGSSFLSDLTLIICSESAIEEAAAAQQQAGEGQPPPPQQHQRSPSSAEPQPGTPDTKALCSPTPAHPPPPAAATAPEPSGNNSLPSIIAAANSGASKAAEATGDAPCSGQDHHGDEAHVLPQSPHRAAAAAGVGPLSAAAFMQRSASQRQLLQQGTAATAETAAADTSAQQPALRPIATSAPPAPAPAPAGNNSKSSSSGLLEVASLARTLSNKLSKTLSNTSSSSSSQVIVMPVHGVVLAAASPYFETLLRGWACSHQPLQMVVGEEQLAAAQQLLSFMYTGVLQANLPQSDLLQLLLLADRFDVGRALAAARRGLASLSPECFEWTTLNGVWSLPQHLYEGDGEEAAALRGVAWERLLQLFGDLEEAWSTADGRAMWQQLPWRAVSALVASDALAVASENTTFAAVSSWVAHQQHQQALLQEAAPDCTADPRPSLQELQLLTASIRLPALGPCYLSYVCLQQDWFSAAVDTASLARAAAFAAAGPEVRKDLMDYTATSTAAAMQAAAAAAAAGPGRQGCCLGRSAAGGSSEAAAVAAGSGAIECIGSTLGSGGAAALSKCSSCGGSHQSGSVAASLVTAAAAAAGCGSGGDAGSSSSGSSSSEIEHRMQLLVLAQSMQRQRAVSAKRAGQFSWRVDVGAIRQLYDDVAAAGSRDSRILRSPAHSFAGYEWALQLEVTQTRGATGFDVTKPWSLGVFLTCQVRLEQPALSPNRQQQQQSLAAATAGQALALPAAAAAGDGASHRLSISGSSSGLPLRGSSDGSGSSSKDAASASSDSSSSPQPQPQQQQQQQQLVMRLVDFGFVSTSATISLREAAAANKRLEKSWEHAVVRYRASWGWPNFLDAQAVGWDESMFSRWLVDGQLQLSARVRVLG